MAPVLSVRIIAGDRQSAADGEALAEPLVAEVTTRRGAPVANARVAWTVGDGGIVSPAVSLTDEHGRAEAHWTLGANEDHEGAARVGTQVAAAFSASEPPLAALQLREVAVLRPRTFEGSRQTVHPDFARTPADWSAYALHLALTPYPNSSTRTENPSVYVSRGGRRWFPESGVTNPVVSPASGYLSDPDLVYVAESRELWLYYRQADVKNRVMLSRSQDGITWSAPEQVLEANNHSVISPSVVRRSSTDWLMWSVDGGEGGCNGAAASVEVRRSRDGRHWGRPEHVDLRADGRMPWHIEVQWVPELRQFWALYPVKRPYTCATQALYAATSTDGITWTSYPSPLLVAGDLPQLSDIVYRSTFEYDAAADEFRFWFSGAVALGYFDFDWRTVEQRRTREDVLTRLLAPSALRVGERTGMALHLLYPP